MTVIQLKSCLFDMIARYFAGATVCWTEQGGVKSALPFVTLRLGSVQRERFPHVEHQGGVPVSLYPSQTLLEVMLYTKGAVRTEPGRTPIAVNTALSDMQDFLNYMDSSLVQNMTERLNIALQTEGPTQDVSALLGANQYEFRALQEFTVDFLQEAHGAAGIAPYIPAVTSPDAPPVNPDVPPLDPDVPQEPEIPAWEQTASGGGTQILADACTGWFEDVEIRDEHARME